MPCDEFGSELLEYDISGFSADGTILVQLPGLNGNALAHELGHNCGLGYTPDTPEATYKDRVIYPTTEGNETLLTMSEAAAYE